MLGDYINGVPENVKERNAKFSLAEKEAMYARDEYAFDPSPVHCEQWDDKDWIRYIDRYGIWLPKRRSKANG